MTIVAMDQRVGISLRLCSMTVRPLGRRNAAPLQRSQLDPDSQNPWHSTPDILRQTAAAGKRVAWRLPPRYG